jgi:hypothetical protein
MGLLLAAAPSAWAHHDPPGCFGAGVDVDIAVFRKTCSISLTRACTVDANCPAGETCGFRGLTGPVAPCETIYYDASLSKDPDASKCAFEGGVFKLVLPDGTDGAINNNVPCLGGTTSPCDPAVTRVDFVKVPYTVNIAPPTTITANAIYTNGNTHDGGGAPNDDGDTIGAASGSQGFSNGVITCADNTVCTTDTCDTTFVGSAACMHTPIVCTDNDPCTSDACNAVTGCFFTPGALNCNDNDPCTSDACVPGTGCVNTPGALNCNDNDPCTSDACVPGTGCVNTPGALNCNDNDPCTSDACVPGTGCVNTPGALDCNDNDVCTSDACVPGTGCVNTPGAQGDCNDNDVCTADTCDPVQGCVHTPDNSDPSCAPAICRTPGFWKTHGAVSQQVINAAGGCLEVCGEVITTATANSVGNANSVLEAMCISPRGESKLQLVRQLTGFALNCVISEFGPDCGGSGSLGALFDACNDACINNTADVGDCISAIDCFANGGLFDPTTGLCGEDPNSCHERALPDFINQQSADTPQACNAASKSPCTVVPTAAADTDESLCTSGVKQSAPETCP